VKSVDLEDLMTVFLKKSLAKAVTVLCIASAMHPGREIKEILNVTNV
jgi:hypothetical protein